MSASFALATPVCNKLTPSMYSQQGGRPGSGAPKMANRYMKGRLPEGVDFAAYPGRSSTPLPTAESKSAERINQLKIWNEAATNDEKRRLNAAKGIGSGTPNPSGARRTDSFKDAKDRHSASFHGTPPPPSKRVSDPSTHPDHVVADTIAYPPSYHRTAMGTVGAPRQNKNDMFADRSDSDTDEDADETAGSGTPAEAVSAYVSDRIAAEPLKKVDQAAHTAPMPSGIPMNASAAFQASSPAAPRATNNNINHSKSQSASTSNPHPEPKESKACCTIM